MDLLESHHTVLVIHEGSDGVSKFIENLNNKPTDVTSLQANELVKLQPSSKYDFVLSGVVAPHDVRHDGSLLSSILKAAKPDAKIVLRQAIKQAAGDNPSSNQLITQLKLSGFTKISELRTIALSDDEKKSLQDKLNIPEQIEVIEVDCRKPNFEVGSSAQLKLKPKTDVSAVWKLDDTMDDDVETIDPDNLLDEDDIKKPDAPLKVCSTTGKRKACKDCSCGLAEELMSEQGAAVEQPPKSSCGSCYLGDAFRCATCPYLGMPAFKPGEKIQLSSQQMQADT